MDLETTLDEINKIIVKLDSIIKLKNKSGDYFINSLCEDIFIETFNIIFKCNFKNLNYSKPNAPAIDLLDDSDDKKIIIQVTSSNTPKKLLDTITKYDNNNESYGEYKELYHFILTKKSDSYKQKEINSRLIKNPKFIFNVNEHIIDIFSITNLLKKSYSNGLNVEKIIEIKDNLEQAINGFEFKFKSLKSIDKNSFNKTNYKFKEEELKLERNLINDIHKLLNVKELIIDESIKYILIKSDAGYGKSYLLNDTFNFLFEQAMESYNNITPYILNLKEYNNSRDFKENISIKYFDKRKKPLLILDGLDEITDEEEQKEIESKLLDYLKNYKNVRCIISSRYGFKKIKINEDDDKEKLIFKQYILSKLNEEQIENYLNSKNILKEIKSDSKFRNIAKSLQIPFNLYNVCQYYIKNRKLSDSIIYINNKRIDEDIKKYSKKNEMLLVKTRVSLEKLSVINNIVEKKFFSKREIGNIINFDEEVYQIFKKINLLYFDEIDEKIRFNNNNKYFEDILVTYFLKNNNPRKIFEIFLISDNEYLIPKSWYNSLSMLVSTLDIESSFSKNIIENHPYILIQSEEIGLSEKQINKIFQNIFNIYEEKDIWINEQKFDLNKLAEFGETNENFAFLISKLNSINFRTRNKAISLLRKFLETQERADILFKELKKEINESNKEHNIWESYYCFSNYESFLILEQKKELIDLCVQSENSFLKNNEYIRASIYHFITVSNLEEEYIDYMLEGLKLLKYSNKGRIEGRSKTSLMDEGYNLDKLFYKITTKDKLILVIKEITINYEEFDDYHTHRIYDKLINTIEEIIDSESNNKDFISKLTLIFSDYDVKVDNWYYWQEMMKNFNVSKLITKILKSEKVVLKKLLSNKDALEKSFHFTSYEIAKLITENSYIEIFKAYDNKKIEIGKVIDLYYLVETIDSNLSLKMEAEISSRGGKIEKRKKIIKENEVIKFQKENFNLLFDEEQFKKDIIGYFGINNTIEYSWTETPSWYDGENFFNNDLRIIFLKTFIRYGKKEKIFKNEVISNLENNLDWMLIKLIFEKKSELNIELNIEQLLFLETWVKKEAIKLNFKNAIYDVKGKTFRINENCITIYKYIKELNLIVDKATSLDLLSFSDINNLNQSYDDKYNNYFEKLIKDVNDFEDVKDRVFENLTNRIKYSTVLNNHIIFSFNYNIIENYNLIEDLLIEYLPELQEGHFHDNPLLVYYDKSKNFSFLKNNFPNEITDLFWAVINYLVDNNEHKSFVEEKLLNKIDIIQNYDEKLRIISNLLKINSKNALLKFYETLDFIKKEGLNGQFRHYDYNTSINKYENEEIETAIKIIELTYQFEFDNFDNPRREIIAYLKRMITKNKENYNEIKSLIEKSINDNKGVLENIQFLEFDLNDLKETFYSNYKSNYTLKDALKIISKIE